MKTIFAGVVITTIFLTTIATGCKPTDSNSVTIEVKGGEFDANANITKTIEVIYPGLVIVKLDSNPSTGFSWVATAVNSDTNLISQSENKYVAPDVTGVVGAAGKTVWTFRTLKKGTATLNFEYSQPWAGEQKSVRTVQLIITVK